MHSVLSAGLTNADLSHCIDSTEKNKLKKLKRAIKSCHYRRYKLVTVARLSAFLASYDWNTLLIMLSCLNACITFWLCFQPVAQQVLYRHPLLPSLSWLLVMPECVWLKACAGVSGNALLMGPAIRQPSPLSQRKTRWKHAACQWLIKEWSSVYSTAERNSKSLCSPRALSGGSPALLNAPVTVLHTLLALCVFVLRSNGQRAYFYFHVVRNNWY